MLPFQPCRGCQQVLYDSIEKEMTEQEKKGEKFVEQETKKTKKEPSNTEFCDF